MKRVNGDQALSLSSFDRPTDMCTESYAWYSSLLGSAKGVEVLIFYLYN